MIVYHVLGDGELGGDLRVGEPLGDEKRTLLFAAGKVARSGFSHSPKATERIFKQSLHALGLRTTMATAYSCTLTCCKYHLGSMNAQGLVGLDLRRLAYGGREVKPGNGEPHLAAELGNPLQLDIT